MYRKGGFAVTTHGNGDIDKTIAYYHDRIKQTEEERGPEPDRKDGKWMSWAMSAGKLDRKISHFNKMIAALEKTKKQKLSSDRIHKPSNSWPSWSNPNDRKSFSWRFIDHVVSISQRPRGTRGPAFESQLLTVAIPNDPQTEEETKDRERLVAELKTAAEEKHSPFHVAVCNQEVVYQKRTAHMFILSGVDVDIDWVKKDINTIVRIYNKQRPTSNVKLV